MTPAQALIARQMTERELQDNVIACAETLGWLVYHTHDSRRSPAGFPDLVLARDGRLILAELKTERGRVRAEQAAWLAALGEVDANRGGVEVYIWRPSHWLSGEIEAILRGAGWQ